MSDIFYSSLQFLNCEISVQYVHYYLDRRICIYIINEMKEKSISNATYSISIVHREFWPKKFQVQSILHSKNVKEHGNTNRIDLKIFNFPFVQS